MIEMFSSVWGSSLFRWPCLLIYPKPKQRWHYRVTLENEDNKTWPDHDHYIAMFLLFYYDTSKTCNQEKQTTERIVCHIGKADKLGGTSCFLRRTWSKSCTHSLQKGRLMSQCLAQYLFVLCRAEQMRIFMIFQTSLKNRHSQSFLFDKGHCSRKSFETCAL